MTDKDRIRLAEAMGWGVGEDTCEGQCIGVPPGDTRPYGQGNLTTMPDPFTDANDDYAVLEWMRDRPGLECWIDFKNALAEIGSAFACNYQIGDYARAALAVLDD